MGKSTISTGPFSIAMLNYQRVSSRYDLVGGLGHECYDFRILGMSSSQLTNSIIFQRGLNHQPGYHSDMMEV